MGPRSDASERRATDHDPGYPEPSASDDLTINPGTSVFETAK